MLLKLVLVLFFLEVSGNIAFKKFVGSKIISGEKSPKHYPYQISLQGYSPKSLPRKFRHFCGGCIISENFFLTAAHCIYGQNISEIVVLAGTSSLKYKEGELLLPIASCVSHPKYILVNTSDIALCKVQIPFVFGKDIGKINLDKSIVGPNENCLLTGWGSVSMIRWLPIPFFDKFAYPDNLMRVNLPTISNEECSNKIKRKIDDTQICTYSRFGQGSCSGDSGGPLVKDGILVGLVSYGTVICSIGLPDVFTRVSYFVDWINLYTTALSSLSAINGLITSEIFSIPDVFN